MVQTAYFFLHLFLVASVERTLAEDSLVSRDSLGIRILDYDQLKPLLEVDNDTTYVVNFWATWCSPCVKELPYFIQLDSMYSASPFKLVLVSLDFKKDYYKKLKPFVQEKRLEEYVVILEDNRSNYWIDDIDKSWGGSIPATLVFNGQKRAFYERTFHDVNELSDIVKPFLNL
ncbi:MAG TPA: TlpA disulfide reductase family protein [Saprospiraceae bacterium]|nr:TlpA disulfide reductase family protein [Saprospiraceae bacterium]